MSKGKKLCALYMLMSLESMLCKNDGLHFYIPLDFHFYHYHKKVSTNSSTCQLAGLENTQHLSAQSNIKISKR